MTRTFLGRCAALATALFLAASMAVAVPAAATEIPPECMRSPMARCGGGGGGGGGYAVPLSGLTISSGTMTPAFSSGSSYYEADVANSTTSVTVTPTSPDAYAAIDVNGNRTASGSPSVALPLDVGSNVISVVIHGSNGGTYGYQITVRRAAPPLSSNANLAELRLSLGKLSPAFDPAETTYTASVGYSTTQITLTAASAHHAATTTIDGAIIPSAVIPLAVGSKTVTIVTTAQDGTKKTTTITITRAAPSTNADLTGLQLTNGTLSPTFAATQTNYTATVPYLNDDTTVTATADATASVTINGAAATSAALPLNVGENIITIVATAEDGTTTKTTTVTITREAPDLTLSALTVSTGALAPAFSAETTQYTLSLPYAQSSVDVAGIASIGDWTLEIDDVEASHAAISAPVGTRTVTFTVTARDGEQREYRVTITRAAASSNPELRGLSLTEGTLSPAFTPSTTSYTASVDYLTTETTVEASAADATTTVTINGAAVTSATVPLAVGANLVTIVTTAEDGVTSTSTEVTITRSEVPTPAATIDVDFVQGDDSTGARSDVSASNLLPGSTATLTMYSTPVVLATGTVLADGTIVLNAVLPAGVEAGAHRLVFDGVAQDGTPVTRTVWFTVLLDGSIGAVSLLGPVAYVEPAVAAPAAVNPARALPVTGTDASAPALLAGLLLVLGGGLLVSRRRFAGR